MLTIQLAGLVLHAASFRPATADQGLPMSPSEGLMRTIARDFQQNQCKAPVFFHTAMCDQAQRRPN